LLATYPEGNLTVYLNFDHPTRHMNKTLFTLAILALSLYSSGLAAPAIAAPEPVTNQTEIDTSRAPGTPSRSETTGSSPPSGTLVTSPNPANSSTPTTSTTPATGSSGTTNFLPLFWASGVLHLLELVGLVTLLAKSFKLAKDHGQQQEQIQKLVREMSQLQQTTQRQAHQLKTMGNDVTAKVGALDRKMTSQPAAITTAPAIAHNYGSNAPATPASDYPFLDLYQQSTDSFKQRYNPTVVSENQENFQKRWAGDTQEIILSEDRQGNYWLFQEGSSTYLIPNPKFKANDLNMRTAGSLFEHTGYYPNPNTMKIVHPTTVVAQAGSGRWKLEQKGCLEFT
jgi:hypothetical protein